MLASSSSASQPQHFSCQAEFVLLRHSLGPEAVPVAWFLIYVARSRFGSPEEIISKLLGSQVRVFVTKCVQHELRSMGAEFTGALACAAQRRGYALLDVRLRPEHTPCTRRDGQTGEAAAGDRRKP